METAAFQTEKGIQITSVRFRRDDNQVRFESYPRRIVYKGRVYVLAEA